jgi:hypothetical protein
MPYQVSWQSVAIKSQAPVHVLGVDADVVADVLAGAALLAAGSAAHAALAAPAAASIVTANMPSFVMPASTGSILTWKKSVTRQNERLAERFRFSDRRATVIGFESGRSLVIATRLPATGCKGWPSVATTRPTTSP